MKKAQTPTVTTEDPLPGGIAGRLLADQHSLPLSIALHLVPGALIVAVYMLIAEPLVKAIGYPPLLGWAIALCLILIPVLVGLLWLGRKRNGRFSLRGVLHYTDRPVSRGKLVAMVIPLIVWMGVLSFATVSVNKFFFQNFFTWVPFTDKGGTFTAPFDGASHSVVLTTLVICLPLTGISLPFIEELYFRGFLLPRLPQLGRWAPLVNTALFSLYHFWSPWVFVSRVIFFFPGPWLAWKNKDIRVSIGMHVGVTSLTATLGAIACALNLFP
ncbi:CPBP family intramembrane glutamic endopeptidase [Nocardia sp. NPDC005998]|uniref:CPBP family intramembrane glutamic endopeptidase n=1 Tax=Nocardia sp. NPDC005998 TaxID=3156894 RepID=UPI0033BEACCA